MPKPPKSWLMQPRDENGLALTTAALEVLGIVLKQFDDTDRIWDKSNDGLPVPSAADYPPSTN